MGILAEIILAFLNNIKHLPNDSSELGQGSSSFIIHKRARTIEDIAKTLGL